MPNQSSKQLIVWSEENLMAPENISINISSLTGLFVTTSDDIYVDTYNLVYAVQKWTLNSTDGVPILYTCGQCYDLFIDISNTLYCALADNDQVVKKSLNTTPNSLAIVAGTGVGGSASDQLNDPQGIFIHINFDLYVADSSNSRIQLFRFGELNATTVAGSTASGTITLYYPTSVVLDADTNLFIVDQNSHRIVASGLNGFRCIVGCSGYGGLDVNQLNYPQSMAFDSYGNLFVVDRNNQRIQKFILMTNSCSKFDKYHIILISERLFNRKNDQFCSFYEKLYRLRMR